MSKSKASANRSILEWAKTLDSSESFQQSGNSSSHYDSQDLYSSGTEDAADDHDGDSEHMISGSSQPDHEDDHIMLDTSAEDAFERPSKNASNSVIPGSPHQPLLAVFLKGHLAM